MEPDCKSIEIIATDQQHLDRVAEFLEPFAAARQILPRTPAELLTLVENGFVAFNDTQIVGFAAVEVYSKKLAEIQCLTVDASFRGKGLGCRLVQHCVELATQRGVIELMAITATEELFRRCGFDYSLPQQKRAMFIQIDSQ